MAPQVGTASPLGYVPRVRNFVVVGLFRSGMYEYDATLAYIGLRQAQDLLAKRDMGHQHDQTRSQRDREDRQLVCERSGRLRCHRRGGLSVVDGPVDGPGPSSVPIRCSDKPSSSRPGPSPVTAEGKSLSLKHI